MDSSHSIRRRRQHAPEFKRGLVRLCQPGISVSAIALAYGVNTNLLRRWINQYSNGLPSRSVVAPAKLVPVQLEMPADSLVSDAIEISIQKNSARVSIRWPGQQAQTCALWLADLLK